MSFARSSSSSITPRGRRQMPQAWEVRRPRRAGVVDVVGRISSSLTSSHRKRRPRGGGWARHIPAPAPPRARFCDTSRAEWGVRGVGAVGGEWCPGVSMGALFRKACPRLDQGTILASHELESANSAKSHSKADTHARRLWERQPFPRFRLRVSEKGFRVVIMSGSL